MLLEQHPVPDVSSEASRRHAQQLESVGRLAAGIAHEINTPIQFISDNVQFLQDAFSSLISLVETLRAQASSHGEEARMRCAEALLEADWAYLGNEVPKALTQTVDGLQRVTTIVHSMKTFAHDDHGDVRATDLNAAVASTLVVATHELNGVAVAVTDFDVLPPVMCSRGDMNQVLLNLIVNAAHAISDVIAGTAQVGSIRVSTRRDGDHVTIAVSDTGGGIPDEVAARMFDPFFTTKEVGRGTGQGLALARAIVVDKHKGTLSFETRVGAGTTFTIRLPIAGTGIARNKAA